MFTRKGQIKKVLFLDIDGVLNSQPMFTDYKLRGAPDVTKKEYLLRYTDNYHFRVLNLGLNQVKDLKIVISSTWRKDYTLEDFKWLFEQRGIHPNRVIGTTINWEGDKNYFVAETRENEILHYVQTNNVEDWFCLDDREMFESSSSLSFHFHQVNPEIGLTIRDVEKMVQKFKPDYRYTYFNW